MTDAEAMADVKALIRFYENRGKNWLCAAEFVLAKHSGRLDLLLNRDKVIRVHRSKLGRKRKSQPQAQEKESQI